MTYEGGANTYGNIFCVGTNGTNYQNLLSLTGISGAAIGAYPNGSLVLSSTTLYGMTSSGANPADGHGNILGVGIDGSDYEILYSFSRDANGCYPYGDLTLSSGTLFGMTFEGGDMSLNQGWGVGTVFALALPTPEPGTLALVGAAGIGLLGWRWRRRKRRA
jgi:hypothetical protein